MSEEKKELFSPFELEGAYIMVSGLQKGKILHIAPEIRKKVEEKGLGFPLADMCTAYFTSKQIKAYSKSELKKLEKQKKSKSELKKLEKEIKTKAGIREAVAKTKKIEQKATKKNTAKKTSKKVEEEEKVATNAALSWFTQVLQDSLGGIQ